MASALESRIFITDSCMGKQGFCIQPNKEVCFANLSMSSLEHGAISMGVTTLDILCTYYQHLCSDQDIHFPEPTSGKILPFLWVESIGILAMAKPVSTHIHSGLFSLRAPSVPHTCVTLVVSEA